LLGLGSFSNSILPLLLAHGVVKDGPYCLLIEHKVGGNVQQFPGGAWALASQLMDQLLAGGSCEERSDDIGVSNVGQLGTLPRKALNVLMEGFIQLLAIAPEVLGVARAHIGALEVHHKTFMRSVQLWMRRARRCSNQALTKSTRNRGRLRLMKWSSSMPPN
jgi:hypothetical protein